MTDDLKQKIADLIHNENKEKPLTDEQLSQQLAVLRETITIIRQKENIPNSRERKRIYIDTIIKQETESNPEISVPQLKKVIEKRGCKVSKGYITGVHNLNKGETIKTEAPDVFAGLVGAEGSLLKTIKQGKAAILYPPFGLPSLMVGASGTGKTLFADYLYQYAIQKQVLKPDAPFVLLNCADYSDNPQMLISILYGYKKGAFTGAEKDTSGLVEAANEGMLFLDEIHRLPPKGQEMLFSILDRGKFRRMGEVGTEREVKVVFLGATTENLESSLLLTFRRRIPIIMEMPDLEERSLKEKVELIYNFFQAEANRINCKIFVHAKIVEAFMLKKYLGNIGQLKSEIQVTCANAYVDKINSNRDEIHIGFNEILYQEFFQDISFSQSGIKFNDTLFIPNGNEMDNPILNIENHYSLPEDIYKIVEEKYHELKKEELSTVEVEKNIWEFLIGCFDKIRVDSKKNQLTSLDDLKYIVDDHIIQVLKTFMKTVTSDEIQEPVNEKVLGYLAIHLSEAIKRIKFNQDIMNPNLSYIKENFADEFILAENLAIEIERSKRVEIPEGEVGFIAMYIHELLKEPIRKSRIVIITISHGKVASELTNVAKKMLNVNFPIAIDMPLDVNPIKIFEQVVELSKSLDTKKGILFFVDMGSLINVGEIVYNRTGIRTRTVDRVDIVSLLEAVRKADALEESLDDIYYDIIHSKHQYSLMSSELSDKPSALITTCLTGHGVALKIKAVLHSYYEELKIVPLSILDDNIKEKVAQLKNQYNILAAVGTINPKIEGLNFIPFESDFSKEKRTFLDYLLKQNTFSGIYGVVKKDCVLLDVDGASKKEIIEKMGHVLFNHGFVKLEYIKSVFEREEMNSTCFKKHIAIPHGLPEYVNRSQIIFARLREPIVWDPSGNEVRLICLLAIKSEETTVVNDLFKILKHKENVDALMKAKSVESFVDIICNKNFENMR